ncbi:hypothetical protein T4C_9721 [Trichinella pseudospiralis]|uniref:Uncharacterized protein n=1 Tax=Trichinella pseudospiralis TaxID=6337 RepID=A0A0V1GB41_TRIPS|nr:hypothetical protein T4C_9721 [Trichinella pseudospiralis]
MSIFVKKAFSRNFGNFLNYRLACFRKLPSSWGINGCESWHCLC